MAEPKFLDLSQEEINKQIEKEGLLIEDNEVDTDEFEEESEDTEDTEEQYEETDETDEEEETEDTEEVEEEDSEEESEDTEEEESEDTEEEEFSLDEEQAEIDFSEITHGVASSQEELQELLSDEYIRKAIQYYKETKTLAPYALAKTYGSKEYWQKVSDIDVMKQQLQLNYADVELTPQEIDLLVEEELSRYTLDPEDHTEQEILRAKARLKVDAAKARNSFIEQYRQFEEPPARQEKQVEKPSKSPEEIQRDKNIALGKLKKSLSETLTKDKLTFKAGDSDVELKVSPKSLIELGMSQKAVIGKLFKDGKLDWEAVAFLSNREAYKAAIQNAASKDGMQEFVKSELRNKPAKKGKKPGKAIELDKDGIPHPKHWKFISN